MKTNGGQITILAKITLGVITTGMFAFGGWLSSAVEKVEDTTTTINREQDKQITRNETNIEYMKADLTIIKLDVKDILKAVNRTR